MVSDLKIRQTNLNNGAVAVGKFNPRVKVFFGIEAYGNHDTEIVMSKLLAGETKFIVSAGENSEILYEII